MASTLRLTALYEPAEDNWTTARLAEVPGVITCAPSRAQAREELVDALGEYLRALPGEPAEAGGGEPFVLALTPPQDD
jgi:predicted RNase H-like HicB family nuclease